MSKIINGNFLKKVVEATNGQPEQEVLEFYNNSVKRFIRAPKEPIPKTEPKLLGNQSLKEDFSLLDIVSKEDELLNPNILTEPRKELDKGLVVSKDLFEETDKLTQLDDDVDLLFQKSPPQPRKIRVKVEKPPTSTRYRKIN